MLFVFNFQRDIPNEIMCGIFYSEFISTFNVYSNRIFIPKKPTFGGIQMFNNKLELQFSKFYY